MKSVGELKTKVEKTESKKEAKELIKNAGIELTEEEMNQVSGGAKWTNLSYPTYASMPYNIPDVRDMPIQQ